MLDHTNNPLAWDITTTSKPNTEALKAQLRNRYEYDSLCHRVFSTEDGKRLLSIFRENTIEAGTWMASLGMEKAVPHAFAREGQNAFVRAIEQSVDRITRSSDFDSYSQLIKRKI